jgi:hypothetical protein
LFLRLGQVSEAIAGYRAALTDLHAVRSTATANVAARFLRAALEHDAYDETVGTALSDANPTPEPATLYEIVHSVVEPFLTQDGVARARRVLAVLRQHPPIAWPPEIAERIEQLHRRAESLKTSVPTTAPASQPTSAPTSRPVADHSPG